MILGAQNWGMEILHRMIERPRSTAPKYIYIYIISTWEKVAIAVQMSFLLIKKREREKVDSLHVRVRFVAQLGFFFHIKYSIRSLKLVFLLIMRTHARKASRYPFLRIRLTHRGRYHYYSKCC